MADSRDLAEASELLQEVNSWSDEEVDALPKLYREKATEFRGLLNSGPE